VYEGTTGTPTTGDLLNNTMREYQIWKSNDGKYGVAEREEATQEWIPPIKAFDWIAEAENFITTLKGLDKEAEDRASRTWEPVS